MLFIQASTLFRTACNDADSAQKLVALTSLCCSYSLLAISHLFLASMVFHTVAMACACKLMTTTEGYTQERKEMEIYSDSLLIELTGL